MPRTARKDSNLQEGAPLKPTHLSTLASREWDRLTVELEQANIRLTTAHRATLSLAATIAADIATSWATIETEGLYWVNAKTGEPKEHPAAKRLDALRRDYLKALTMLGLRTAVASVTPDKEPSLDDLLNG